MASPKDGTPGTLVPPAAPGVALDADDAQPGEVEAAKAAERESQTGKYGSTPITPYVKPTPDSSSGAAGSSTSPTPEQKKSWIAIHLVDTEGEDVPGECYQITLPDQSVATGTTDATGRARVDGFPPGPCKVTFPNLDKTVVQAH